MNFIEKNELLSRLCQTENKLRNIKEVELPERYIINENACILFWKDGSKTIVKRAEDDEFNSRIAYLTAFFQRYCGMSKNKANKYLSNLVFENSNKNELQKSKNVLFKIGDKVELISSIDEMPSYKKYIGEVGTIISRTVGYADVKFNDGEIKRPYFKNLKKIGGK